MASEDLDLKRRFREWVARSRFGHMRVDDVARIELGTFLRPAQETGTGTGRVETVLGYVARTEGGLLLLDTGLGEVDEETDAWYRPRRTSIRDALRTVSLAVEDIELVVNCHLHFDHIGANPLFAGRPILCQRQELEAAHTAQYTVPALVDFHGARYELLDGESQVAPGVHVIPTPGHVAGHQSIVLECEDGSIVLAGQAHEHCLTMVGRRHGGPCPQARSPTTTTQPEPMDGSPPRVRPQARRLRPRPRRVDAVGTGALGASLSTRASLPPPWRMSSSW